MADDDEIADKMEDLMDEHKKEQRRLERAKDKEKEKQMEQAKEKAARPKTARFDMSTAKALGIRTEGRRTADIFADVCAMLEGQSKPKAGGGSKWKRRKRRVGGGAKADGGAAVAAPAAVAGVKKAEESAPAPLSDQKSDEPAEVNDHSKLVCPHCGVTNTFAPGTDVDGAQVACASCKKPFVVLFCPRSTCGVSLYFTETNGQPPHVTPGSLYACYKCQLEFSLVTCPSCRKPNYCHGDSAFVDCVDRDCSFCGGTFCGYRCRVQDCKKMSIWSGKGKFPQGLLSSCAGCQGKFTSVICPTCSKPNLWLGEGYRKAGMCNCVNCDEEFVMVNCPSCTTPCFWENLSSGFVDGHPLDCKTCNKQFCIIRCPDGVSCGNSMYYQEYNQGGLLKCKCGKDFKLVTCREEECGKPNYFAGSSKLNPGDMVACGHCKKETKLV